MKNLEMVKKLAQEGKIQEALENLQKILLSHNNVKLNELFTSVYNNSEVLKDIASYVNYTLDKDVDLEKELNGTFYEYCNLKDGSILIKKVTTESIMNTIEKAEKLLKIA